MRGILYSRLFFKSFRIDTAVQYTELSVLNLSIYPSSLMHLLLSLLLLLNITWYCCIIDICCHQLVLSRNLFRCSSKRSDVSRYLSNLRSAKSTVWKLTWTIRLLFGVLHGQKVGVYQLVLPIFPINHLARNVELIWRTSSEAIIARMMALFALKNMAVYFLIQQCAL